MRLVLSLNGLHEVQMNKSRKSNGRSVHKGKSVRVRITKIIFLLFLLIGSLAAVMVFSPLLLLSDIYVDETTNYTAEEIINASGIKIGENAINHLGGSLEHLLNLRMGIAEKEVEKLPYVKTAIIKYEFPKTVNISVTERNALALIRYFGNFLLVDEEGYVLEVKNQLDDQHPQIRGVQLDKFALGDKIQTNKPEKIAWVVQLLQSLNSVDMDSTQKLIDVVDWIDILENRELYISLDDRITAKIKINDELTYRLSYLKEIYYNHIKPDEKGMIDFYDDKYARFIAE